MRKGEIGAWRKRERADRPSSIQISGRYKMPVSELSMLHRRAKL